MTKIKSIVCLTLAVAAITLSTPTTSAKEFLVTGYYSPLPNQSVYMTGTYQGDIRLNGRGTNGASGQEVFNGMIAAPKKYTFGTRLHCPGYGTGIIHDRGGAIVAAGERGFPYDRLDFYFGAGEEALAAALEWGIRAIDCTEVNSPAFPIGITIPKASAFTWARLKAKQLAYNIKNAPKHKKYFDFLQLLNYSNAKEDIVAFQLQHGIINSNKDQCAGCMGPSTRKAIDQLKTNIAYALPKIGTSKEQLGKDTRKLQQILFDNGYLTTKPTGYFGPKTTEALIALQLEFDLIENKSHRAAGYVGPSTIQALQKLALRKYAKTNPNQAILASSNTVIKTTLAIKTESKNLEMFTKNLKRGDSGEEVKTLQLFLRDTGYLNEKATAYYGWNTTQAVLDYQIDQEIVSSHIQQGAGVLGPTTRKYLNANYYTTPRTKISGKIL
jgi:peptidoglycan hydrolase-like protein with peptidoglycan-binding domain/3D (Asp-Asp-Asp) domain-containing protein